MLWNGYREYGGNWNEFLDIFLFFFFLLLGPFGFFSRFCFFIIFSQIISKPLLFYPINHFTFACSPVVTGQDIMALFSVCRLSCKVAYTLFWALFIIHSDRGDLTIFSCQSQECLGEGFLSLWLALDLEPKKNLGKAHGIFFTLILGWGAAFG